FVSDRVVPRQGGATVSGPLTMHGVTRRITFPVRLVLAPYRLGSTKGVAFSATLHLSRKDYGIAGTNRFNPDYDPLTNMLSHNVNAREMLRHLDHLPPPSPSVTAHAGAGRKQSLPACS